jgi:FkbM family methyltransferase
VRTDKDGFARKSLEKVLFALFRLKMFLRRFGFEKIPGVPAMYRFLKRHLVPGGTVLVRSGDNLFYVDLADEVMTPALIGKVRRRYEIELFESLVRPGMVILDVGANIGYFAVTAARNVGDSGKVYAFEPEPHNFELLRKNLELNGIANVTTVKKAVSDSDSSRVLFVSRYNLGSHSFSSDNAPDSEGSVEVETVTLDGFRASVMDGGGADLLKMDCQGAESLIVDGARRLLAESAPMIVLECWPYGLRTMGSSAAELVGKLESLGYSIWVLDEDARSMDPLDQSVVSRFGVMENVPGEHLGLFAKKPL